MDGAQLSLARAAKAGWAAGVRRQSHEGRQALAVLRYKQGRRWHIMGEQQSQVQRSWHSWARRRWGQAAKTTDAGRQRDGIGIQKPRGEGLV